MARRLKVLISAYACEPGKGSEPEVGWQWAMQMAASHDVTVLTRANNRPLIEQALKALPASTPRPTFVYHDRDAVMLGLKKHLKIIKLYYLLWQRSAHEVVKRLNQTHQFDLMHHVTFAAFRYPTAMWGHGVPAIWGPVGGITSIPFRLLPWRHPRSLGHELLRSVSNMIQSAPYFSLPGRGRASAVILASTVEMQERFAQLGLQSEVMPAIGLETSSLPSVDGSRKAFSLSSSSSGREGTAIELRNRCEKASSPQPSPPEEEREKPSRFLRSGSVNSMEEVRSISPLKLLFVGKVITLKGIDIALDALHRSGTGATLTVIGDGSYLEAARRQVQKLGLADRVFFEGRLTREQVLARYREFDVFLFPSLHDTGGYAVIEAMLNQLPVICLDCGGPAVAVEAASGIKVPLGSRQEIVDRAAMAIRFYDGDRHSVQRDGQRARERVLKIYDWQQKGQLMEQKYQQAVGAQSEQGAAVQAGRSQFSKSAKILSLMFSLRGIAVTFAGLALVATLFFLSLGYLKSQARSIVSDNLTGMAYAGEANSTLAEGFDRTLLLMFNQPAERRAQLEQEIETLGARTAALLDAYQQTIFTPMDQAVYANVIEHRDDYLRARDEMIKLVNTGEMQAAAAQCQSRLLPAYAAYKGAADKLFEANMQEGKRNGEAIMRICTGTQILVAAIGVLIFIAGFLIGVSR
jgi:glycosyltransferase involved in cell wall biosynthesis